jgi:hypothetical protein
MENEALTSLECSTRRRRFPLQATHWQQDDLAGHPLRYQDRRGAFLLSVLLLVTGRRKGGRIPGFAWPLLQRPGVLVALYGLFLLVLLFHGLFLLRQGPLTGPAPAG